MSANLGPQTIIARQSSCPLLPGGLLLIFVTATKAK
jgi:hypothetical protein